MNSNLTVRACLVAALFSLVCCDLSLQAQKPSDAKVPAPDEVIRIDTELVQSPVIVLDKQGNFVGGLTREQFELTVNNHAQPLAFFDEIIAGTARESEKYEALRKGTPATTPAGLLVPAYGRTIVFFVDDYHLSPEGVSRTRAAILNFIDNSLGQNDRAMVISATGQIGFLQQLTDNKDVLRAAANRIKHREFTVSDEARPAMNAYQALAIETGDSKTMQHFADMAVEDTFKRQSTMPAATPGQAIAQAERNGDRNRRQAEDYVRNRARNLLNRYSAISASTLSALSQSMVALTQLPGSKLAFFISDGFFLNQQISGELQRLNEITSGAMRSGAVVYSIQSTGLSFAFAGANTEVRLSPRSETGAPMVGQDTALQAPLYTVAVDTGGRALFNANSMDGSIKEALGETAKYYLLAWRPDTQEKRSDQFHKVQIRVKDHPEWTVRTQKGYFLAGATRKTTVAPPVTKPVAGVVQANPADQRAEKMRETLSALYPVRDLPTLVTLNFLDQPVAGATLNVGTKISVASLSPQTGVDKQPNVIDLAGVLLNDEGKTVSSFAGQLKFQLSSTDATPDKMVTHVEEIKVKPGLYQLRIAARDEKSGLAGSANDWILVPDLVASKLALSSILTGDANAEGLTTDQKARLSIDRRFTRAGRLRFLTYAYNAARGADGKATPDLSVQLRVMRDDKVISTSPPIKVSLEGVDDLGRIPYGAQIPLSKLAPGHYSLSVVASDNLAKSSATQTIKFVVE